MGLEARKNSIGELFSPVGDGLYIPSFQRPYSWGKEDIHRLFEDIAELYHRVSSRDGSDSEFMFLGTVLTVHDKNYDEVIPAFRPQLPQNVWTVIDGQQRLCVFTIIHIVLHRMLTDVLAATDKLEISIEEQQSEESGINLFRDLLKRVQGEIRNLFLIDRGSGEFPFYPKLIRAEDDVWSTRAREKQYESPIGSYQWKYIERCVRKNEEFDLTHVDEKVKEAHNIVVECIRVLCRKKLPSGRELCKLVEALDADLQEAIKSRIDNKSDIKKAEAECIEEGLRLILLSKLIANCVYVISTRIDATEDAYSIFDALNTTGELLTAVETFKPVVVRDVTAQKYPETVFQEHFDVMNNLAAKVKKPIDKQRIIAQLVVHTALGEEGEKIGNRLSTQRKYLKSRYLGIEEMGEDPFSEANTKTGFTQRMAFLAEFTCDVWNIPDTNSIVRYLDETEKVMLKFLGDLKHTIVIPPLAYFFSTYRRCKHYRDDAGMQKAIGNFKEALLASSAFTILWRAAWGGTKNIESHYRDAMKEILSFDARKDKKITDEDLISQYKMFFRNRLIKNISSHEISDVAELKNDWLELSKKVNIYDRAYFVAKIILHLVASRATVCSDKEKCFLELGREGVGRGLSLVRWNSTLDDLEHIAPRPGDTKQWAWAGEPYDSIYDTPPVHNVDLLGNLLFLPGSINRKALRGCDWKLKKQIYIALGSTTERELKMAIQDLDEELKLSKVDLGIFKSCGYHILCEAMGMHETEWDLPSINRRTTTLLDFTWDLVFPWLE